MFSSTARRKIGKRRASRFQPALQRLEDRALLSTFRVNTTLDTVATDLKRGRDANGNISLRSAIQAANARGGSHKIILPNGTFTLSIAGVQEDASATGDLDINRNLTIQGSGAGRTVV